MAFLGSAYLRTLKWVLLSTELREGSLSIPMSLTEIGRSQSFGVMTDRSPLM